MARRPRAPILENRTNRLKLAVRRKPHFTTISPGVAVGYRRNKGAGAWIVRTADGHGGNWTKAFATADDHEHANGDTVLTFWQAQDRARVLARGGESNGDRPLTVGEAVDNYERALKARGGNVNNATRVRFHLPPALAGEAVALLTARDLRGWRDRLIERGVAASTADRVAKVMKAALNLAAADDPARITNAAAWRTALAKLPEPQNVRNAVLEDSDVRGVVAAAYAIDHAYGRLIETAATTGQRASQLLGMVVADLQDGAAPRLLVPSSRKGRRRRVERKAVPIPAALAATLRTASAGRSADAPLLVQGDGQPWREISVKTFRTACAAAGLADAATLVPYALRHSSICRMLLAGVPTRIVASAHDTSVTVLESVYSRFITGDPSDALIRRSLLDLGAADHATGNVVSLVKA